MGSKLTILLAVSLAVNIFLGGYVAGRILHPVPPMAVTPPPEFHGGKPGHERWEHHGKHFHRDRVPPMGGLMARGRLKALSPEGREIFRAAFKGHREEMRANRQEVMDAMQGVKEVLEADTYDREKLAAAMEVLAATERTRRQKQQTLLLDVFDQLSDEDRKALAKAADKHQHRWGEKSPPGKGE